MVTLQSCVIDAGRPVIGKVALRNREPSVNRGNMTWPPFFRPNERAENSAICQFSKPENI